MRNFLYHWVRSTITYSQEIVLGLAWIAFGFIVDDPLVATLQIEYPSATLLFQLAFTVAGVFMLVAAGYHKLLMPAFVFSSFVALGALIASLGVDPASTSVIYPITWVLLLLISSTQAFRHFKGWTDIGD